MAINRSWQSEIDRKKSRVANRAMHVLVLDTDFLIKATSQPLPELADFLASSRFELVTLPKIKEELNGLTKSSNAATARKARLALQSLNAGPIEILKHNVSDSRLTDADVLLIEFAENSDGHVVVATLDHHLLSSLERRKLPYLTLRKNRPFFRSI